MSHSYKRGRERKRSSHGHNQCSSCKNTCGEMVRVSHVYVKEGWSLFIGEWFMLKCFMGDGVVFRGGGIPSHLPSTRVLGIMQIS